MRCNSKTVRYVYIFPFTEPGRFGGENVLRPTPDFIMCWAGFSFELPYKPINFTPWIRGSRRHNLNFLASVQMETL